MECELHNSNDSTTILANSLWMNQNINFQKNCINTIVEHYYASSYQGKMGSERYNLELRNWLNKQTEDLLKDRVNSVKMERDTLLSLVSTIYFRERWSEQFSENATKIGTFHAKNHDSTCDFMYESNTQKYYWGDKFSAISKAFYNHGTMWFILPDQDTTIQELLMEKEVMELCLKEREWFESETGWEHSKYVTVNALIPKFDISYDINLVDGLKELGIKEVFDPYKADFSSLLEEPLEENNVYLSQAEHAVRVMIDEKGCKGTAYTILDFEMGAALMQEEIDFVLDRPFLFVITGIDNTALFIGVVNEP